MSATDAHLNIDLNERGTHLIFTSKRGGLVGRGALSGNCDLLFSDISVIFMITLFSR